MGPKFDASQVINGEGPVRALTMWKEMCSPQHVLCIVISKLSVVEKMFLLRTARVESWQCGSSIQGVMAWVRRFRYVLWNEMDMGSLPAGCWSRQTHQMLSCVYAPSLDRSPRGGERSLPHDDMGVERIISYSA